MVTLREYYANKIQIRPNDSSILLHSGRLFQQYVIDMYIKLETQRLDYIRNNQPDIRQDLYQGILDSIAIGEKKGGQIGKPVILPASFIGGPRDMKRRYLDAMALVQRYGKPDLFITMTCNPTWPEITNELLPGEDMENRPDVVARVFRAKFEMLLNDLFKKEIFGPVAGYVYVVEFQKRGLPHVHILVILQKEYKIRSASQFDQFVSAEIPPDNLNNHLRKCVKRHMIHGPCGEMNPECPCMVKGGGKCNNKYPKDFRNSSSQTKDSYPLYRRRNDGRYFKVREFQLDNRWIVPYNPYLLAKYDCHINVEICSTIKSVKYLYKYIYKGHDKIIFQLQMEGNCDEATKFQKARWVAAPEAMWRIYRFLLNKIHPSVLALQLHLPNQQNVAFNKYSDLEDVRDNEKNSRSMLSEFFKMNTAIEHEILEKNKKSIEDACERNIVLDESKLEKIPQLLYKDFPEHFRWDVSNRFWIKRLAQPSIGRIVNAHPNEGERYYLRLLLNHSINPKSFELLKTVDGHEYDTFREAALHRGLLKSNDDIKECLQEATSYSMPSCLRYLFATVLANCEISNPRQLWETFADALGEDFAKDEAMSVECVRLQTLKSIGYLLESMSKDINTFNLIDKRIISDEIERGQKEIFDELHIPLTADDLGCVSRLNVKQKEAFDEIMTNIDNNKGRAYFVDGPGGTGKTFLYRALLASVRQKGQVALATASSGVAASILPGGRTAHSRFKLPLDYGETENMAAGIKKQSSLGRLIKIAKLIIWDEAPMIRREAIETFEAMLRDVCGSVKPFGNKVVIFGGDFRQVLPVIPHSTPQQNIDKSLLKSHLWEHLKKIHFTENMRAQQDPLFANFLMTVGNGVPMIPNSLKVQIPPEMCISLKDEKQALPNFIAEIYGDVRKISNNLDLLTTRAILTPKNEYVEDINSFMVAKFDGDENIYHSFDKSLDEGTESFHEDYFHSLNPSGFPPHILRLKKNCPIMLLRNLAPSKGLCNGTRLICKSFQRHMIHAQISIGDHKGKDVFLPRIPLKHSADEYCAYNFERVQFPVRLSFAMTINKAQGQTLDFVGLYLPQPVFSHGQLYVALSRARNAKSIKVLIAHNHGVKNIQLHNCTDNIVYVEVLRLSNEEFSLEAPHAEDVNAE